MKIDTAKIEGYADMTPEQKLAALEGFEFEEPAPADNSAELKRLRDALTKANSEAADYKKQLRAKQTDDEAKAQQEAEAREAMQKELEGLRKDKAVSTFQAKFLGMGYDEKSAAEAAAALQAGDFDAVFAAQEKFTDAAKKAAVAESLKQQPGLTAGKPLGGGDVENPAVAAFRKAAGV